MKNRFTSFWRAGLTVLCGTALALSGLTLAGCDNGTTGGGGGTGNKNNGTDDNGGVWTITTIAGSTSGGDVGYGNANGAGTDARFGYPTGITRDSADSLFVADFGNNNIRKLTRSAGN
jgi:hypothetical protein